MTQVICDGCHKVLDEKKHVHLTAREETAQGQFEFCDWGCVATWAIGLEEAKPE